MTLASLNPAIKTTAITLLVGLIATALCLVMLKDSTGIKTVLLIAIGSLMAANLLPALLNLNARWITRVLIALATALVLFGIHAHFK